jgi:hypothetical protein
VIAMGIEENVRDKLAKIKEKDQRVFLDGIYIYEKSEGM